MGSNEELLYFFVASMNKLLNKQFSCQIFAMPWYSCDETEVGSFFDARELIKFSLIYLTPLCNPMAGCDKMQPYVPTEFCWYYHH